MLGMGKLLFEESAIRNFGGGKGDVGVGHVVAQSRAAPSIPGSFLTVICLVPCPSHHAMTTIPEHSIYITNFNCHGHPSFAIPINHHPLSVDVTSCLPNEQSH